MKKGQKVRLLRTNETGTVANQELIRKNGQVKRYVKVRLDKSPNQDTWFMEDELGDIKEKMKAEFTDEHGRVLVLNFTRNYCKEKLGIDVIARNPENIKEHLDGLHAVIIGKLLTALGATSKEAR